MKWPVTRLETRLKASIRKLFRSVQSHRERKQPDTCALSTATSDNTQIPVCSDWPSSVPNRRLMTSGCSQDSHSEYQEEPTDLTELYISQDALANFSKLDTEKRFKETLRSDACATTNDKTVLGCQNSHHQTEGEYNAPDTGDVDEISRKRPRMKNTFTQPMQSEYIKEPRPGADVVSFATNVCTPYRNQFSKVVYAEHLGTGHHHDSAQFNYLRCDSGNQTGQVDKKGIFAGDSNRRCPSSATHYFNHTGTNIVRKAGWPNGPVVVRYSVERERSPDRESKEYIKNTDDNFSLCEPVPVSVPSVTWNHSVGVIDFQPMNDEFRFNAFDDSRSSAFQGFVASETSGLIPEAKSTKECGDEDMLQADHNEAVGLIKFVYGSRTGSRSTVFGIELSDKASPPNLGNSSSSKGRRKPNLDTNTTRSAFGLDWNDAFNTSSSSPCNRSVSGPTYSRPSEGHQQAINLSSAPEAFKPRPATAQPHWTSTVSEKYRPKTEDLQMIHHNCTAVAKEAISQRSDKSDFSGQKYHLYPHSTSDDGDPSKVARMDCSVDRSSASSAYSKPTRISRTRVPSSSRRNFSKSPAQPWPSTKQSGALPASRDLNMCPTGRHLEVKHEKPCICMMVKRMVLCQSKPVLYSWHAKPPRISGPSSSASTATINPPDVTHDEECRLVSSVLGCAKSSVPALPSFQLARPTRMVRGGQGTVAWVTDVTTGNFYALKFKLREGRSDSTWAIERREAKLLRHTKHDFIVRLFHIYETEETLFMALEWLDGGCLWNHIARTGTVPECYGVYYGACILSALRYLHSRFIVYRDMKAENVVLDNRGRPKLIDFGMAKRFAKGDGPKPTPDLTVDSSVNDTEDFEQPPTRYYFAAYLAPEIYDHLEKTSHHIDSWGLGYILVEMLLGYGIFSPMPWEQEPGKHLSANWKLKLPHDSNSRISPICEDFVHKMLRRKPEDRMNLEQAQRHTLFSRVPWSNLGNVRGPDLSKCSTKGGAALHTVCTTSGGSRRWMTTHGSLVRVPDLAFVREFYGSLLHANMTNSTQTCGLTGRGSKVPKIPHGKGNRLRTSSRHWTQEIERSLPVSSVQRNKATMPGNAIEIRGSQPIPNDSNTEMMRESRRRLGSTT